MQDLDIVGSFVNAVEHYKRRVNNLPHTVPAWEERANVGEPSEQLDMIQKIGPEALSRAREIDPGVFDDLREIG